MRPALDKLLRPIHDTVFERWVYEERRGPLKGLRRRGRPPWLRRQAEDPRLDRELAFLEGLDLAGGVAFDVGANRGVHSLLLRRLVGPPGAVHAFEPDPFYLRELWDLVLLNRIEDLEVHGVALGATPGASELVVPDGRRLKMAGTLAPDLGATVAPEARRRTVRVRVAPLDAYRRALGLPAPTFVKVDVEGFEREVLAGARETLEEAHPTLMIEVHGLTRDAQRAAMAEIIETLRPLGYRFWHLESQRTLDAQADLPAGGHLICRV